MGILSLLYVDYAFFSELLMPTFLVRLFNLYLDTERELRLSRKALKVYEEADEKGSFL